MGAKLTKTIVDQVNEQNENKMKAQKIKAPEIPNIYKQQVATMVKEKNKPVCDADCLKTKWMNSKNKYKTLPNQIDKDEKNYYVEYKGETYYRDNILKKRYTEQSNNYRNSEQKKFEDVKTVNDIVLKDYETTYNTQSRITELYNTLQKQQDDLKNRIDNYSKQVSTDSRRIYYENQGITTLKFYRKILLWIYYPLLILYILFGSFIKNKEYTNYKIWIAIIIYIIFPYLLKYIVNVIEIALATLIPYNK